MKHWPSASYVGTRLLGARNAFWNSAIASSSSPISLYATPRS